MKKKNGLKKDKSSKQYMSRVPKQQLKIVIQGKILENKTLKEN